MAARMRTDHPEHRQHRLVGRFSDRTYRLFQSVKLETDDQGRFDADADKLRVQTWPYHPEVTTEQVEAALQELVAAGLVQLYEHEGGRYGWWPKWKKYQKPKYPTPSKHPDPPKASATASPKVGEASPAGVVGSDLVVSDQDGSDRVIQPSADESTSKDEEPTEAEIAVHTARGLSRPAARGQAIRERGYTEGAAHISTILKDVLTGGGAAPVAALNGKAS